MTVDILLSTYNSEAFLNELVESIYLQSYKNWRFIIRDDCSSDRTVEILNNYQNKDTKRFIIIENNGINLGPKKSFEKLLEQSTSDYIMFCDHDDYWLPQKIEDSLNKIKEIESGMPNKAALVFTDLILTDQNLKKTHNSFWNFAKINPLNSQNIYKLSINNPVVGCTVTINKAARALALPIPDEAIMHDWWIALKVAESGVIDFIDKPSILYRQHPSNKIGVQKAGIHFFVKRLLAIQLTIKQNIAAFKMLKTLNKKYSGFKMMGYKVLITIAKMI